MSHFPPPAADEVIYRENGGGRRGLPRWVPLAGAAAVVAALGVAGWAVFGGGDADSTDSPWQLLRLDLEADQIQRVELDGSTATYAPLGALTALAQADERSTLVTMIDDDAGTVTVLDAVTGEAQTVAVDTDNLAPIRFGDVLVSTSSSGAGGEFVDLRSGVAIDLHRAFGVPSDVRLFSVQPGRDGVAIVFGDDGAGVFNTAAPDVRHWFEGALYDAAGTRAVAGTVGAERTLTLYDGGEPVGSPVTVQGRVRVRLQAEPANTAVVVEEDGRVVRADFESGQVTELGRVDAEVMSELPGGDLSAFFVADDRFLVELDEGWALLDDTGKVVARYTAGQLEPGATEVNLRGFGTTCMSFVVGGSVPDRTAVIDIATGEVRIDVAGQVFGVQSVSGCSLVTGGNADIVVVDGAVVEVPGSVVAHSPDFSQLLVRAATGSAATRATTVYTLRDGELVDPITLEPGSYSYLFVPTGD